LDKKYTLHTIVYNSQFRVTRFLIAYISNAICQSFTQPANSTNLHEATENEIKSPTTAFVQIRAICDYSTNDFIRFNRTVRFINLPYSDCFIR